MCQPFLLDFFAHLKNNVFVVKMCLGKPEELPRKPLGQELPVLLSPVQPPRGKPSSASGFPAAALSLHIISHQPDTISPDQSPSKDPRDLDALNEEEAPLPSPDPIIIHSQAPLTPDGSPLTGPPPYQPPGSEAALMKDHDSTPHSPDHEKDEALTDPVVTTPVQSVSQLTDTLSQHSADDPTMAACSAISSDQASCSVPQTLSAATAQVTLQPSDLTQSESLSEAEMAEDSYLAQLLEEACALPTNGNMSKDTNEGSEATQSPEIS